MCIRDRVEGLQSLGTVHVLGVDGDGDVLEEFSAVDRVPRVSFLVDGVPAGVVVQRLLANGVVAGVVAPGQSQLLERMGVFEEHPAASSDSPLDQAGAVAVGFAPHNTVHDVEQLVRVVASVK